MRPFQCQSEATRRKPKGRQVANALEQVAGNDPDYASTHARSAPKGARQAKQPTDGGRDVGKQERGMGKQVKQVEMGKQQDRGKRQKEIKGHGQTGEQATNGMLRYC